MNIAVCENEAEDRAAICGILGDYLELNRFTGEIHAFASGEELLSSFSPGKYDVIFLDIYMGGVDGVETAKRIRETDAGCIIIFVTTSPDHSLESYSVRGAAYVLKPVRKKEMQEALRQCREIFLKNARYIEIRADRMDIKIPLIKIYYAETFNKISLFHTSSGDYKTFMPMEEIEAKLGGKPFYRCHQSYIINMNHIEKVAGEDVFMKNGDRVPMRTRGRDAIRAELAGFLSKRMFEL